MSNECRYHAVGDSVYFKGILRVRCSNGNPSAFEDLSEDCQMAQEIARVLNHNLRALESFEPKVRRG
jgi:hypothetical protein